MSPRPTHALMPRPVHPRDGAAVYYAVGLTAFDPDRRRFAGADTPIPHDQQRRERVLQLLDRAANLILTSLRRR